jgi:hypothetical protein
MNTRLIFLILSKSNLANQKKNWIRLLQRFNHLPLEVNNGEKIGLLRAIAGKFNTNTCYSEFLDFLEKNGIRSEGYSWT